MTSRHARRRDEELDVVTATGVPVGRAPRTEVHAQGRWHQTFHCLVVRNGPPATVVLQRRHRRARAFPGLLDLSATGHLHAGEGPVDGLRELNEELGLAVSPADLVPLGVRLLADDGGEGRNRERTHCYLLADDRPLDAFAPDLDEVDGLVEVRAGDLLAVLGGTRPSATARQWRPGEAITEVAVSTTDLVPPIDGYWIVVLVMAERFAAGETPLAI